jgi:hypothetical protein
MPTRIRGFVAWPWVLCVKKLFPSDPKAIQRKFRVKLCRDVIILLAPRITSPSNITSLESVVKA